MGIFSNYLEKCAQDQLEVEQIRVSNLHIGWHGLTKQLKTREEVLTTLNNALSVVNGLKDSHTSPSTFYSQVVINSDDVIAVYYCKTTNKFKSI